MPLGVFTKRNVYIIGLGQWPWVKCCVNIDPRTHLKLDSLMQTPVIPAILQGNESETGYSEAMGQLCRGKTKTGSTHVEDEDSLQGCPSDLDP